MLRLERTFLASRAVKRGHHASSRSRTPICPRTCTSTHTFRSR